MLKRIVPEGGLIPRGYGCAYRLMTTRESVFYPIPLNWIAGWWREALWFLQDGPLDRSAVALAAAKNIGFQCGYETGQREARDARDGTERDAYRRGALWGLAFFRASLRGEKSPLPEFGVYGPQA